MEDRQHIKSVNGLIITAMLQASKKQKQTRKTFKSVPGVDKRHFRWCYWTQYFHEAMAKLTKEAGLRG